MATASRSINTYRDVHNVFLASVELGEVLLVFETSQAATAWNQRANFYRSLLRQRNEAKGGDHVSEFDHLIIRKPPDRPTARVITDRGVSFTAYGPDGAPINLSRQLMVEDTSAIVPTVENEMFADFLNEFEAQLAEREDDL